MMTITTLLLAHLVADFPLQTNSIVKMKNNGFKGLGLHVLIHVLVLALLIKNPLHYWPMLLILATAHFITDWAKVHMHHKLQTPGFIADQIIHILTLVILASIMPEVQSTLPEWFLFPAIILALIPAFLTLFWVIAGDFLRKESYTKYPKLHWASTHLHPISRSMSVIVMVLLIATAILI